MAYRVYRLCRENNAYTDAEEIGRMSFAMFERLVAGFGFEIIKKGDEDAETVRTALSSLDLPEGEVWKVTAKSPSAECRFQQQTAIFYAAK